MIKMTKMTKMTVHVKTFHIPLLFAPLVVALLAASLVAWLPPVSLAGPTPATSLRIEARELESREPLPLERAELLLLTLGDEHAVELPVDGAATEVRLDREWLCDTWPEGCKKVARAYLFLEARDHALLRSDPFPWPGVTRGADGPVEISFPRNARVTVASGQSAKLEVTLRRPAERTLRVIGDEGPVAGLRVEIYRYRSHLDECGSLSGELLATIDTDDEGRIDLPDGDFEYAFVFDRPHLILREPQSQWHPNRWITRLDGPETLAFVTEIEQRPLHMKVTLRGEPQVSLTLHGCRAACPKSACAILCCGPMAAATDSKGALRIEDFRPGAWEKVYFVNRLGQTIWEGYPYLWTEPKDPMRVELAGRWAGDPGEE